MKNPKGKITLTVYSSEKLFIFVVGWKQNASKTGPYIEKSGPFNIFIKTKYLLVMCDMDLYSIIVS